MLNIAWDAFVADTVLVLWTLVRKLISQLLVEVSIRGRDRVGHYDVVTLLPY